MGNSARSHSSFGVPAQSSGKLREDAAVTDVKGMCVDWDKTKAETECRKRRRGGDLKKKTKKNRDRNKVYVSGWPPR